MRSVSYSAIALKELISVTYMERCQRLRFFIFSYKFHCIYLKLNFIISESLQTQTPTEVVIIIFIFITRNPKIVCFNSSSN